MKLYNSNAYIVSVISKLIVVTSSFLSSVLINRYLGPDLKGQYAYIFSYVGILSLILNFGIGQSYTFFKKNLGVNIKQEFINIFFLQLLVYTVVIIAVNLFYSNYVLNIIFIASILTQFNSQVGFMAIVSNVNLRNIITVYSVLIHLFLLTLIYFFSKDNLNLVIIAIIAKLSFDTINLIIKNKFLPTTLYVNVQLMKEILKFSFFPMLTSLLIVLNYSLDVIILKQYVSFADIGIYSVGVALAGMLWVVPDAFKDVLFSKTSNNDSTKEIVFSIKFNVYFCLVVIIGFIVLGKDFINLFYGKDYLDAYNVTILLFVGCIPMIFFKMINTLYISIGKQRFAFVILFIAVIGNVGANYLLIPFMGIEGAAIASIFSYFTCGIIFLVSFLKKYGIPYREIIFFSNTEILNLKYLIKNTINKR